MAGIYSKKINLVSLVLTCLIVVGCVQSGSQLGALEGISPTPPTVEEQKEVASKQASEADKTQTPQEVFVEKQLALVEQQKKVFEEQRQKQLALIEENKTKYLTSSALAAKPSDIVKSKAKTVKKKPSVKKASVATSSRAAGNITLNAPWKCVPNKLKAVIREVSRRYGPVIVNSTRRSRSKNRRVGGAKRSYHLRCQAADFRVRGNTNSVLRFLRNHPHVGGLKRYRSGYFHIDTGPRRTWRG